MLVKLFGSDARVKVLSLFLLNAGSEYYLREIAQKTGLAVRSVQRAVGSLVEIEILKREKRGNSVYFVLNSENPIAGDLKAIFLKTVGLVEPVRQALEPLSESIAVAFIYGSIAKGEARAESDIDLMIVSANLGLADVYPALGDVESTLGRSVNPNIMTLAEWKKRRQVPDSFAARIASQPRLFVLGDGHDLD
ncbi:nucleotidyltransferase domain-containing protein [Candidatus Bipolaricaulota bacterium]|nr:nucleotidyltransferase domain-containing protein [Candidatus Bipolaricaulota bacterium]